MPDDRTIDFVVMFIVIGTLSLGLLSMFVGWLTRTWDRFVNRSEARTPHDQHITDADDTDSADEQADGRVSVPSMKAPRLQLDRTRTAVIEELLTHGWTITDMRREGILRGENSAISAEVDAARKRLGIEPPDRTLKVRDANGERVIPY